MYFALFPFLICVLFISSNPIKCGKGTKFGIIEKADQKKKIEFENVTCYLCLTPYVREVLMKQNNNL